VPLAHDRGESVLVACPQRGDKLVVRERHSAERTTRPQTNQRRRGPKGRVLGTPAAAVTPAVGQRRP
jgi:hypothetical protein